MSSLNNAYMPFTSEDFTEDAMQDRAEYPSGEGEEVLVSPGSEGADPAEPLDLYELVNQGLTELDSAVDLEDFRADVEMRMHEAEATMSPDDTAQKGAHIEKTRTLFHELPAERRLEIARRRREIAVDIMRRRVPATAVLPMRLELNHARLRGLFESWWPYLNRMSLNIHRFGNLAFSSRDQATVQRELEEKLVKLESYVAKQFEQVTALRQKREADMVAHREPILRPTVTGPAASIEVEALSRFAVRALMVIQTFDRVLDAYDFMVWNGLNSVDEVNAQISAFGRRYQPLGLQSYTVYRRLLATRHRPR